MAVEDELVLSADEVAECEVGARVASARHEHLLTALGLADVERRRREIHDQLRSREREVGRRRAWLPDVLADREPNGRLPDPEEDELTALREVAVLVEHAVVREEVLSVDGLHASVGADGTPVREIAVEPRRSDQRGDALRPGRDRRERLLGCADETRAQEEVFGWISRRSKLREENEVGAASTRFLDPADDLRPVAREVADDAIELRE